MIEIAPIQEITEEGMVLGVMGSHDKNEALGLFDSMAAHRQEDGATEGREETVEDKDSNEVPSPATLEM